ncbi:MULTISPECIES: N-6 DNA methylase [unclassified Arthrobacter]|uniref:N-6 DNA methylase n=1 Tax=unclassified Arthrobacter TaxID=235627 RepID=UPI00339879E8
MSEDSTYRHHMKDAQFKIPNAGVLKHVVDIVDSINMDGKDTKGDLYEYMLSMLASAGTNGQFRTPRHIFDLMVALEDWPDLAQHARRAEQFTRVDPRASMFYARYTAERLVDWLFKVEPALVLPYKDDLNALLNEPAFKN